jgi:hypothetical protein
MPSALALTEGLRCLLVPSPEGSVEGRRLRIAQEIRDLRNGQRRVTEIALGCFFSHLIESGYTRDQRQPAGAAAIAWKRIARGRPIESAYLHARCARQALAEPPTSPHSALAGANGETVIQIYGEGAVRRELHQPGGRPESQIEPEIGGASGCCRIAR